MPECSSIFNLEVDFAIVGGGIFGCYSAVFLRSKGFKVALLEREPRIWQKASVVNQARLHFGYHYPRSIATAMLANEHRSRFREDHRDFINDSFTSYYGIDAFNSLTNAQQFVRFCERVGIPAQIADRSDLFVSDRIEALFETEEYSFDPLLLRSHYTHRLDELGVHVLTNVDIVRAEAVGDAWCIEATNVDGDQISVSARAAVNATYSNLNAINRLFGVQELEVTHEISEIALLSVEALSNVGLTVMDGPYMSIMPFGKTGLHSISSVLYTHHSVCTHNDPVFMCQTQRLDCEPDRVRVCTTCPQKPKSNSVKMRRQMSLYVRDKFPAFEMGSLYTVKTKLKNSYIDDARPTNVSVLSSSPLFFCIFSGKINSIYEIESIQEYV